MQGKLSSTLEDYLEAIYRIETEKRAARVRDISEHLGVAKSTVNAALKSLGSKGLIEYEPYELIVLTEKGRQEASAVVMSHEIIRHFLQHVLALDRETAETVACGMEHAVDRDVFERFVCFIAYIEQKDSAGGLCIDEFRRFVSDSKTCGDCVEDYVKKLHLTEIT